MKIGMIALSGVRAHDEELTAFGLTLPGFVERSRVIASLPSLGLLTLAGMTPEDVEVEYLEVEDLRDVEGLPGEFDAVAISSYSAQIAEAYALADRYRAARVPVILGGLHVSARPAEAATHADAVVIGDGELSWPRVVEDLQAGQLQPEYGSREMAFDLGEAPMPRFELLDPERYNRITVQTTRGCPYDCEFCAASIRLSPGYRLKPVSRVVAEVRRIKEIWAHPFIEFADDNTFAHRKHGRKLMRALADEGVRWFTETDIGVARDAELLELMRDAGCAQVLIGLESPTAAPLRGIELRSDWKARQVDGYLEAIEKIQSHGISVNGCFVLGIDGTTTESFEAIAAFVEQSGLHEVQITVQTPFPGTPLHERLHREGRLLREDAWELCTLFDVNFRPTHMSVDELRRGLRELAATIYNERAVAARRHHFREQLREVVRREHRTRSLDEDE